MSVQVKFRRGTTEEHSLFTGAIGEVTVDTTKDTLVVHDGVTLGGHSIPEPRDWQGFTEALYAQTGFTPNGMADTEADSNRVKAINILVNTSAHSTIAAAKNKTDFYEGQTVTIIENGLRYAYTASRLILSGQSQSEMTYDDNMHILVVSGGMLRFVDWGAIPSMQSSNWARYAGKLKDRTSAINVGCFGDSITFGQALADTVGATNTIGQPTNFGDGSTHAHWKFNNNYPARIGEYLEEHFVQATSVSNLGYSGDRLLTGYLRHRESGSADIVTVMFGVNDCLFATSNGAQPQGISTGLYSVENYENMLRLFVANQIVKGAAVVILGTAPFASLTGYDGSSLASGRLVRAYNAAAKSVATTFGCTYVDVCTDIFTQYGLGEITQEGTHLNEIGLKILGRRIAAALVTADTVNEVGPSSILIANPNLNAILSKTGGNVLPNASSTTPRGTASSDKTSMLVGTEWISIPFYATQDSMVAFFNLQIGASGCVFDIRLDDGAVQSDFHFQGDDFSGKPAAQKQITSLLPVTRETINISDDGNAFLHVSNKGWHTVSVRKVSGTSSLLLDSVNFEALQEVVGRDMYGVTLSCTVKAGALLTGSKNADSISTPFAHEHLITTKHPLAHNKYTVVADVNDTSANPVTCTVRYKTVNTFGVAFNRFNGTVWELFTPAVFTIKIIGGR